MLENSLFRELAVVGTVYCREMAVVGNCLL